MLVSLSRLSFRLVDEGIKKGKQKGKPTLIYGAGTGGQMVAKEIENNRDLGLLIVGFLDDNPRKYKRKVMGYPVLGGIGELDGLVKDHQVQEIIVSFKRGGDDKKREIKSMCSRMDMEVEVRQMTLVIH